MKRFLIILAALLVLPLTASAVTVGWTYNSATNNIQPYPSITTTASTSVLSATTFCLTGDICRTTWPSGGSSASSTLLIDNNTFSGINVFSNAASTFAGTWQGYNASTFNNKVSSTSLSVTTIGSSGAATYTPSTGVFNIPQYSGGTTYTGTYPIIVTGSVISTAISTSTITNLPNLVQTGTITSGTWQGTAIADGYIASAANWNAKMYPFSTSTLSASSPLTGSFIQVGSGGSLGCQTASGSQAGCLSSTDWTTFNNKGSGTVTSVGAVYPLSSTGSATPVISSATSSASSAGVLSAADWITFNSKLSSDPNWIFANGALTPTTTVGILVNASSTIGDSTQTGGLTISGGATTTGTAYFAGNVGIGVTNPLSRLSIAGNLSKVSWTTSGPNIAVTANTLTDTSSNATTIATRVGSNFGQPTMAFTISTSTITNAANLYLVGAPKSDSASSSIITNSSALLIAAGSVASGGVVTNGYGLTVNAPVGATNNYAAYFNGLVGIGTTSPQSALHVEGSGSTAYIGSANNTGTILTIANANTTNNNMGRLNFSAYDANGTFTNAASITGIFTSHLAGAISSDLAFQTRNAGTIGEVMRLTAAGNVGIGTTTPGSIFAFAGTTGLIASTTATSTFIGGGINLITAAGNTGCFAVNGTCIGASTSNASSTLLADNNTWTGTNTYNTSPTIGVNTNGILLGGSTWAYASSTNKDTILGIGAGGNSATTSTSGSDTFIGASSGASNSGSNNTAVGFDSMQSNTNASAITAIGYQALQLSTGNANTAVGYKALQSNVTGADNDAFGNQALPASTGTLNSAFGWESLVHLTSGGANAAFGEESLANTTSGSSNTAVGVTAGTSGIGSYNNNTFIGYQSNENSSGAIEDTTALGYESAFNNIGWDSTFLGELSGQNVTSGNNDILIGFNALAPSATASNQLNIGNIIFGTGLAATSSSSTVIPTPTGNVGIGTTTPASTLTINGHIGTDGGAPALTSCGTSPAIVVGSTDTAGEITEGSVATGCTITFKTAYARTPFCTLSEQSGLAASYTLSASAITITNIGALSSTKIDYHCISTDL